MNSFQTIVLSIFGFFILAGLLTVALVKQGGQGKAVQISLWGTVEARVMNEIAQTTFDSEKIKISYREVKPETYDQTLIEALASGKGPDMVLLPLDLLMRQKDKLKIIPYTTYSERSYRDTFIQEADLFAQGNGIAALPFSIDPLVMYFNRDLLDEVSVSEAPKYWDEFIMLAKNLTVKNDSGDISRSAVALGEYRNINSAKPILAAMFLQAGNPIIDSEGKATLLQSNTGPVLSFFTEFGNPVKPVYSWNRALPSSRNMFLSSRLGVYFGFGSEYEELKRGNPNLDFDIALFPRPRNASVGTTFGKLTGIAVLRAARDPSTALQVALVLAGPTVAAKVSEKTGLPPVHRALLAKKPVDAFGSVMYDSAIRSRGFLDPNPEASEFAFQNMIESVTSGRERVGAALNKANSDLQSLVR